MINNFITPKEKKTYIPSLDLTLASKHWDFSLDHPVLCLHGWLDNANSFDPLAQAVSKHQLIALDFPGHGYSDHLKIPNVYHLVDYVKYVMAFADHFGWKKFSLIGHSLGGAVAIMVAASFPDRIQSLSLVDSIGSLVAEPSDISMKIRNHYDSFKKLGESRKLTLYESVDQAAKVRP